MWHQRLPPSLGSIWLRIREQIWCKDFQNGCPGSHLGQANGTIWASLNLYVTPMLPSSFGSIRLTVWEEMSFEEFQDGRHGGDLWYPNGTILAVLNLYVPPILPIKFWLNPTYGLGGDVVWRILAILNLYVAPMLPIKVWFNPTYGFGGDVVWRISRWPPWRPAWISKQNSFSNSESLYRSDASHQVLTQSDLRFGRRRLMNFKMGDGGHLGYRNGTILAILNLYVAPMPPIKFRLNLTYILGGDVVWIISRWPSLILEQNHFRNSESPYCHNTSH